MKSAYETWNIEVVDPKAFMTLNMITYTYFFLFVFQFKLNLTDKYFIINIINQVIDQFYLKSKLNNTPVNPNFKSVEFGRINLTLNIHIHTF